VTNQHSAQHEQHEQHPKTDQHKGDQPKAGPPFVVALTPEQYDSRVNQQAAAPKDAPPPPTPMNVGDTGTAKVSFTDETQADVKLGSVEWTSTGPVTINPPEPTAPGDPPADPTTAKFTATGPGRGSIRANVVSEGGAPAEAAVEVMVIQAGLPVTGTIDVTVTPISKTAR